MVQYAALNLACLHARFGHARLASCALDEAVRVAQQRHDHACVTFALGWLRYVDIREAEYEAETYGADPASRLHAIDATRVHLTMKWVVSFSIFLRPFGPSRSAQGRRCPVNRRIPSTRYHYKGVRSERSNLGYEN